MSAEMGHLAIVGLGPGAAEWITPEATHTLAAVSDLVGYAPYLARLPERSGQHRHASDNREELVRARLALEVTVVPGLTAMQAAAARIGAPLGHDFCAISLSANLKPWALIEKRLRAASEADFVIALYNPASKARPDRIGNAFSCLRTGKAGTTPVIFARAIGRADERITITRLDRADPALADMATLVIIGSSETRVIDRPGSAPPFVYTPRSYGARP